MLFDLRGKRRHLIRATFLILAILFAASSIIFFVGSGFDVQGNLFDLFGNDGSSSNNRLEKAEKKVKRHPKDEAAWLDLAKVRYLAATASDSYDSQTGLFKPGAKKVLRPVIKAWESYLKLEPGKPNPNTASLVVRAYIGLEDFEGATKTQEIIADARPSSSTFFELARYAYLSGSTRIGDGAAARSVELTPKKQRNAVRKQIKLLKRQAEEFNAQEAVKASGAQQ